MPQTQNHGLPYPTSSAAPDGPQQIRALAEAVDAVLGSTQTITTGLSAAEGWSIGGFAGVRFGRLVTVSIDVTRTGPTITGAANGNIADTQMATLPSGWRPPFTLAEIASNGSGHGEVRITPAGVLTVRTWTPTGEINPSDGTASIRLSSTFVLP